MARVYSIVVDALSVNAVTDLVYVKPHATRGFVVHEVLVTQDTSETSEQLPLNLFRTATDNAAQGTAGAANPLVPGDSAFSGTVRVGITGANLAAETTLLRREAQNVLGGWHYLPTPEARYVFPGGGHGFVVKLDAAPSSALTISVTVTIEEFG
jgi:hypothetical protein